MGSSTHFDLENLNRLLAHDNRLKDLDIEPTPYTFTKLENGKKIIIDSPTLTPPRWLLLDHSIAVIWLMFNSNFPLHQLNINDLKWAHEFLREIRNSKGENPPDVKTCLKEIQDRLIHLYARLKTTLKEEFGKESISEDSTMNSGHMGRMSVANSQSPSRTTIELECPLFSEHPSHDMTVTVPHQKILAMNGNSNRKNFPLISNNSNVFGDVENIEDTEVEKYFLSLFEEEKNEIMPIGSSAKSCIPIKKKAIPEMVSTQDFSTIFKDPVPKRVHCVAEMTSLKYRKSMKVQDKNGDEAAYADLKAEIQKMTINPNVSKDELKGYLKEWRTEQVDKLRNNLNRLNSIEEIIKGMEEVPSNAGNSFPNGKQIGTIDNDNSFIKKFLH